MTSRGDAGFAALAAACLAGLLALFGVTDLENYATAIFSLTSDSPGRVTLLGVPVYEWHAAFGVRLPLHASLPQAPGAPLLAVLPAWGAYFALVLLYAGVAAAQLAGGARRLGASPGWSRATAALALVALPTVNYALADDWPETLFGYLGMLACVGGVLALPSWAWRDYPARGAAARAALLHVTVPAMLAVLAHPGFWSITGPATVATLAVRAAARGSWRPPSPVLAAVALALPVVVAATTAADLLAEARAAGAGVERFVQGPQGPLSGILGARIAGGEAYRDAFLAPLLLLAAGVAAATGALAGRQRRVVAVLVGAAVVFWAAARVPFPDIPLGPSATWNYRDPALLFALLAGALTSVWAWRGRPWRGGIAGGLMVLGFVHLLAVSAIGVIQRPHLPERTVATGEFNRSWTNPLAPDPPSRLVPDLLEDAGARPGDRIAIATGLRHLRGGSAGVWSGVDLVSAGYDVLTGVTKNRQREWASPSDYLFSARVEPADDRLCDLTLLRTLWVRWVLLPGSLLEGPGCGALAQEATTTRAPHLGDTLVLAGLPVERRAPLVSETDADRPSSRCPLLADASCWGRLHLTGTTVAASASATEVRVSPGSTRGWALLPIAYDAGLRATTADGRRVELADQRGLTAVALPGEDVTVRWRADARAWARVVAAYLALVVFLLAAVAVVYGRRGRQDA